MTSIQAAKSGAADLNPSWHDWVRAGLLPHSWENQPWLRQAIP